MGLFKVSTKGCLKVLSNAVSTSQPLQAEKNIQHFLWQKASSRFFNDEGRGRHRMAILGATLAPADHRNQNATRPKENPSFLVGFRAEDWTAWTRKLRGNPHEHQRKEGNFSKGSGQTTRGPRAPLHWPTEPRQHRQEVRESGKSGAWWARLRSDWLVLDLRAGTQ